MAQTAQVIPLPHFPDSVRWFRALRHWPRPVWLDSCRAYSRRGRYDILSAAPQATLTTTGQVTRLVGASGESTSTEDPFALLRRYLPEPHQLPPEHRHLPFCGGALGYWGYDLARRLEKLPQQANHDLHLPDMQVGVYPWAVVVDHERQQSWLVALADVDTTELLTVLLREQEEQENPFIINEFKSNLEKKDYLEKVGRIQHHIRAGDCYQVNFAQRFSTTYEGDPFSAYLALRAASPAPFAAYLEWDTGVLLCHSPERFIDCRDGKALTSPIKGTIARGITAEEDLRHRARLLNSEKDRAENLMIVDLLRNDLSRTCREVKTPALFELQSFANVHHLVSTVTGVLKPGEDALSLLRAAFPGGSITGAPKIRAMEIIETLEPHRRGPYCGSVGYLSADGGMDTNIAIRTLVGDGQKLHCYGGGGIVADSDPEAEYQESLTKIKLLMDTLTTRFTTPR